MSPDWASLPLLPLRCILDHLSMEDAIAAMSVCRHWRSAVLLFEGRKEQLKLEAKHLDKCLYLTLLFRKHTNKLHIHLDCNEEELDKFMSYVLPQYFDTVKLNELVFIGPRYLQLNPHLPAVKLKRIVTESLIHKHARSLRKLALLGCEVDALGGDDDRFIQPRLEPLPLPLRADAALTPFSPLRHVILEFEQVGASALEALGQVRALERLTLNVFAAPQACAPLDWARHPALQVAVNIIEVPLNQMDDVMHKVLREGMMLTSIKVLYCKAVYQPLLERVVQLYKGSVREVVWADCPREGPARPTDAARTQLDPLLNVNPFVLLCWQCKYLQRLVIHGYWVWQYDLVGFARLRKSLSHLEVSALRPGQLRAGALAPLRARDVPGPVPRHFVKEMNEYTRFRWEPVPWRSLPLGLRGGASRERRAAFLRTEALALGD